MFRSLFLVSSSALIGSDLGVWSLDCTEDIQAQRALVIADVNTSPIVPPVWQDAYEGCVYPDSGATYLRFGDRHGTPSVLFGRGNRGTPATACIPE